MKTLELEKNYNYSDVEEKWFKIWEERGTFSASVDPEKKPFSMVIPPPNITGSLHMGHALNNTIQDILTRFKRMQGYSSLWIPGTDHAGIATQRVVEKELLKQKVSRWDLGREKFLEHVWKWSQQYRKVIVNQLKRMGCSCDWTKERFTLDEVCTKAVREAFVKLYEKGLVFRGKRIINWCVRCRTALSDLEVEHEETKGKLYYLRYPEEGGNDGISIATTRPETIFADTAVAVNPEDPRYSSLIGKNVILPIVGRKLPVIADSYVDMELGSGALKITPAHDANDYEVGKRHNLPIIVVIDDKGIMNEEAGKYRGMERFKCREAILLDLKEQGFIEKIEDYDMAPGTCYRCHQVIEPYLSEQWFIKTSELAEPAIKAVREGRTKFYPPRFANLYLSWMENLKDWCISRQLWWGHRIPVWKCSDCGFEGSFITDPDKCTKCGSAQFIQSDFVLDTWFSSGLWPFSTMGWPQQTPELKYFYPTSVLTTDRGIIYQWVARMMMFSFEFMKDIPFHDVVIHATILNKEGVRMSKSLGTGIDPLDLFNEYGTDATRFGLAIMTEQGQDIRFSRERIEMSRNFANKIWNASRFILSYLDRSFLECKKEDFQLELWDKWILSKLNSTIRNVTGNYEKYQFDEAAKNLYSFFWDNFCDWYIEIAKLMLYGEDESLIKRTLWVLETVLESFLRIAHPIMPFITEEIWSLLPTNRNLKEEKEHFEDLLIKASWLEADEILIDLEIERKFETIMEVIKSLRNMRSEVSLTPKQTARFRIESDNEAELALLTGNKGIISFLAASESLEISRKSGKEHRRSLSARVGNTDLFMPLDELVDFEKEIIRLNNEKKKIARLVENLRAKLKNPDFISKAKTEVVEREKFRLADAEVQLKRIEERIKLLQE